MRGKGKEEESEGMKNRVMLVEKLLDDRMTGVGGAHMVQPH